MNDGRTPGDEREERTMYNEAMARAVLADRARERDAALHSNRMLDRTRRRRSAGGLLTRILGRRRWSGPHPGPTAPAPILAIEARDSGSTPPTELRVS